MRRVRASKIVINMNFAVVSSVDITGGWLCDQKAQSLSEPVWLTVIVILFNDN